MKSHHRVFSNLSFLIFLGFGSSLFAAPPLWTKRPGIEGHYAGVMDLQFERARKINIELTLTLTGETTTVQVGPNNFEERQIIDSAFIVDDEGGPFIFTKVSYNLDKNQLDLRYDRRAFTNASFPADFRLVGNFDNDGNLSGRVMSGNRGPIGTFKMSPNDKVGLKVKKKYQGRWMGSAHTPGGRYFTFDIDISESLQQTDNPFDLEFDYTPGKMGFYSVDGNRFNFNHVVIDFLRQRMFLSKIEGTRNTLTAECDVDFDTRTIRGQLFGMYLGKSADFALSKVR